jgi:uncharacterized membrane protein HdeD (DUF308 family)
MTTSAVPVPDTGGRGVWILHLALGVVTAAAGLIAIVWPDRTVLVVAVIFGIQLLVGGVLRLLEALLGHGSSGARAADAVIGVLFVGVGVLALRDLLHTVAALALLLGLMWLLGGLLEIIGALSDGPPSRWSVGTVIGLLTGVVAVAGGVLVLAWPAITLTVLVVLLGISFVVHGLVTIVQAVRMRSVPGAVRG